MKNLIDIFFLGDICQQFTREIFEMYQNYANYKSWTFEILNYTPADYGNIFLHYSCYTLLVFKEPNASSCDFSLG